MTVYGKELAESIKAERQRLIETMERRDERIANCETDYDDCFISIHVEADGIRACNMKLHILEGDGCMDYEAIIDENGDEVNIHEFRNKWGGWSVVGRGIFASSLNALLKKTGWQKKTIRVPVWVKFCSSGSGMAGVMSGSSQQVRWYTNMVTGEYVGYPD
jgi:hypothetical protein